MYAFLIAVIAVLFLAMLVLNVYFRVKVFKSYKKLVQNRVDFSAAHVFSRAKMESEIMPKYPAMRGEIEQFVRHMQFSIRMASVLIFLITAFGAVLMWYLRNEG